MKLGIFAKTFSRPTLETTLDAVVAHALTCVQFNLSCVGLPTVPESISAEVVCNVRTQFEQRQLSLAALSGTLNLIDPNSENRQDGVRRLQKLIPACSELGTSILTLCTGTRDPKDMWRRHPDNNTPEAWRDLLTSLAALLPTAEQHRVTIGVEPEPSNVVDSARRARQLLDELNSPSLKIILDGANLLEPQTLARQHAILDEAFDLLGADIAIAHAKDLGPNLSVGVVAAGQGALDYPYYLSLLDQAGFDGALILHNLAENEVPSSVSFLKRTMAHLEAAVGGKA